MGLDGQPRRVVRVLNGITSDAGEGQKKNVGRQITIPQNCPPLCWHFRSIPSWYWKSMGRIDHRGVDVGLGNFDFGGMALLAS